MPLIFGIHPVQEALAEERVDRLIVQQDLHNPRVHQLLQRARAAGIDYRQEPKIQLDRLCEGGTHQGVAAFVAERPLLSLEELLAEGGPEPLVLLLAGIEDPHNLGAIIRSADGAGATGIVLPKRRSAPLSDAVWRASAGAAAHARICRVGNLVSAMEWLKARGLWLAGADERGDRLWHAVDLTGPVGLVLGREGEGLHELVRRHCDFLVRLPMRGGVSSLNVSVSAGILLYEAVRQRLPGAGPTNGDPR